MKKWTASWTLCCWMHFWRLGLCRFHSLYNSSRRLRNLLLGLGRGWLPRPSRSRRLRKPSLHGLQRSGSGIGAPPAISSTTISGLSRVKLRLRGATRHRRSLRRPASRAAHTPDPASRAAHTPNCERQMRAAHTPDPAKGRL